MKHVNMVVLLGNVGNDPELRSTTGGAKVATFSLATSEEWRDGSGTKQKKTAWHRCVVWQGLAEVVGKYVGKGDTLHCIGKVEYRSWQDKEGQTRYTTEVVVRELAIVRSKRERSEADDTGTLPAGADDFDFSGDTDTQHLPFDDSADDAFGHDAPAARAGNGARAATGRGTTNAPPKLDGAQRKPAAKRSTSTASSSKSKR